MTKLCSCGRPLPTEDWHHRTFEYCVCEQMTEARIAALRRVSITFTLGLRWHSEEVREHLREEAAKIRRQARKR